MRHWPMQEAGERFDDLLDACMTEGPQVVERDGVGAAVLVTLAEWSRLSTPRWNQVLLADEPRADLLLPDRHAVRMRAVPDFD